MPITSGAHLYTLFCCNSFTYLPAKNCRSRPRFNKVIPHIKRCSFCLTGYGLEAFVLNATGVFVIDAFQLDSPGHTHQDVAWVIGS